MKTINLAVIAGVRAQYIKMASFQRAIKRWNQINGEKIRGIYINSGQHYDDDLAGIFLKELDVQFDYDLTGEYSNLRPINIFGEMIVKLYDVLSQIPDVVHWTIVFGDANTTLAGALAATRKGIKLVHIESGQRSGYKSPEEVNRITTDHISDICFVSSQHYQNRLEKEGITRNVYWSGDIIYDLIKELEPTILPGLNGFDNNNYVLASIHREENVLSDEIMRNVMVSLNNYKKNIAFIAHPRVRQRLRELELDNLDNIKIINTLSYHEMIAAIKGCYFLFTDSGAFQRESYYLGKRCLTRQNEPHWESLIRAGIHKTVGSKKEDILYGFNWVEDQIQNKNYPTIDDFGEGAAGLYILQHIVRLTKQYYNL